MIRLTTSKSDNFTELAKPYQLPIVDFLEEEVPNPMCHSGGVLTSLPLLFSNRTRQGFLDKLKNNHKRNGGDKSTERR